MKTIGLIGGMSWESTVDYYRLINEAVKRELGGLHSAKIILVSVDFQEIENYQFAGQWDKSAQVLSDAARRLEGAGADFILICTNTMHKVADQVAAAITIPLVHIARVTGDALIAKDIQKVGLLGTVFTMEEPFYRKEIEAKGIEVVVPNQEDRQLVSQIIYEELCLGILSDDSRRTYLRIIAELAAQGAEAVILGCTEIGLLVKQGDTLVPLFDTTTIHAESAAVKSLE
ncbi:aspartate/glutamate racemase family protein [Vagococcus sp. BWB3-3]|uniref:Aspartate/glutamate racemase family protein n=1 Tax=Vagococcus allomyrinae TaxID=2794353 RepID=A0A940PDC3_9ENTE|nr:aspartate/glutamate racemase family protein [Vagococcus allomyrinae]MBP1041436.1 aspartate/glutamate racemase family protein [Vagococcus allomyrinae]